MELNCTGEVLESFHRILDGASGGLVTVKVQDVAWLDATVQSNLT